MSPIEFFEQLPSTMPELNTRAMLIDTQYPELSCEEFTVSRYSPGPVQNAEFAFRYIFSPIHIEADGTVKAAAFSDVEDKGLSCDRSPGDIAHPDIHDRGMAAVENYNRDNQEKPRRDYLGCVRANCEEVRAIVHVDSLRRAFGIYDTGKSTNGDHIDVFQTLEGTPAQRKILRKRLRDAFTRRPQK